MHRETMVSVYEATRILVKGILGDSMHMHGYMILAKCPPPPPPPGGGGVECN